MSQFEHHRPTKNLRLVGLTNMYIAEIDSSNCQDLSFIQNINYVICSIYVIFMAKITPSSQDGMNFETHSALWD